MAGVADSAVGAILEIPPQALADIKKAEAAIKSLQATSATASQKIKGHFDNTAVSGLNAFIQKVKQAQEILGGITMPSIDATSFATSISQIAQAMATVDRSATTGANRIGRIADSITKLSAAQPSAQMFQEIANGISAIGNTSQQTIANVSQLAQSMAQLARDIRTVQNAQRAQANDTASASQYNKLYKEQADLTRKINEIKEKGSSADARDLTILSKMQDRWREISDQIDKLNKKKQTAASTLAQFTGANRVGDAQSRTTVSGAINYAQQAKSLKELQDAYKNLKAVMATVDPKSAAWQQMNVVLQQTKKNINDIEKEMGKLGSQSNRTGSLVGQLRTQLTALFGIAAIKSYVQELVNVRAQFELTQVSLRSILQDRQQADRIFSQVQQMALQSPFTIMQMSTYTKQLAAYRVEADKLVGTTKMLADVSAGLGVDMQRLILAYGQVKSANYLRATEVRQFTEAGLNIAGELATYFSELQGKMVSVGDVMEMITKRMVRFEDVEEVFRRVTSAGGMFYDMQKKQSETLYGQVQRISDAYSIMMNDIGKSNQGIIRDALNLIRQMINHWRMLVPIINTVGALMATAFAVKGIYAALMGMTKMVAAIKAITSGLNAMKVAAQTATLAFSTTGIGALITLGLTLMSVFMGINAEARRLKEALADVQKEGVSDMNNLIFQFRQLADTAKDVTKPYEERKEAMDALNRTYKDILPSEMLEIENIRKMKGGYDEAVKAIEAFSAAKTKQNMIETIDNEYGNNLNEATEKQSKILASLNWSNVVKMKDVPKEDIQAAAKNIASVINEEIKSGKLSLKDAQAEFKKRFMATFALSESDLSRLDVYQKRSFDSMYVTYGSWKSKIVEVFEDIEKEKGKITDLGLPGVTKESKEAQAQIQTYKNMEEAVKNYNNALQSLKDAGITDVTVDRSKLDEWQVAALDNYDKAATSMGNYKLGIEEVNVALSSNMDMTEALRNVSVNTFNSILDDLEKIARATNNNSLLAWVQNTRKEINSLNLSPAQKEMVNFVHKVEELNNVDLGNFQAVMVESTTTVADMRKNVEAQINILKAQIEAYQNALAAHVPEWVARLLHLDGKALGQVNKELTALTQLYGMVGGGEKKTGGRRGSKSSADKELKRWQEIGKAIKDVNTKYDELRKSYGEDAANKRIYELYSKVFEELDTDIRKFYKDGTYGAESEVKALRVLQSQIQKNTEERRKYRSELERDVDEVQVEIDVKLRKDAEDKLKKDLDEMFANYELTEELKKVGVSVDLTYMVGGKPTTKDDIRNEIERLRKEGGGSADAENRIKILEDAEKKLTDIELKEQKERLKNYEKYLKQMYSDRAKKMIEAYTDMKNMEQDFNAFIAKLQTEANQDDTTDERKQQIAEQIKSLKFQKAEAIKAVNEALNQNLAKLDWEQFKGSDVFTQLYQDTENLSKKGIDLLIDKLTKAREALQSMEKVDYRAVREITNHIQKLQDVRLETGSWKELDAIIKEAKDTIDGVSLEDAQKNLIDAQGRIDAANIDIAQIQTIIDLKEQEGNEDDKIANLSDEQKSLYKEGLDELRKKLATQQNIVKSNQAEVDTNENIVDSYNKMRKAIRQKLTKVEFLKEQINKVYQSTVDVADALGADTDMWGEFGQSIIDATFSCITLQLQMQLLGIASNSALGIIGWIATGLQAVASLLVSIFKMHDKRLEKQIEGLEDRVDSLSKSFEKLEKSIERAFTIGEENRLTEQALDNLEAQKRAYQEMIALEEAKKKTDDDKIKDYKDKLDELAEAEEELYEKRHEKYGSTNDAWDEANNWVDAWLDAFKENGDGLDALNESWDELYENLVKKQAASKVLGARMDNWIKQINDTIDASISGSMSELDIIDAYKRIGDEIRADMEAVNVGFKEIFKYAGIDGGAGSLSDLQKGIQNITEPQAAAIEAYLNSMRFAVFQHTEQLERLIASVQAQYTATESPMLNELKGIRRVLDSIDDRLDSVISRSGGKSYVQIA